MSVLDFVIALLQAAVIICYIMLPYKPSKARKIMIIIITVLLGLLIVCCAFDKRVIEIVISAAALLLIAIDLSVERAIDINDWINRLLEYTELEKSDIRAACEADKHRKDAFTAVAHAADAIRRVMPCIY